MSQMERKTNIKRLVLTAIMIALATVLGMVKVIQMPLGGSVTLLSMLPIALISVEYGIKWGLTASFANALVQTGLSIAKVFSWGLSPLAVVGTIVFDYMLAYFVIGLSGMFRKKGIWGICIGIAIAITLRFICHVITGALIFDIWMPEEWSNPWLYSVCYNGLYMLPEMVFTMIGTVILFKLPQFNKLISAKE